MKTNVRGLCVIGLAILLARDACAAPEETFRTDYPEAAKKLEDAYRQVTVKLKRTVTERNERRVEEVEVMRDGASYASVRRVVESNSAKWPVGTVEYRGATAALTFDCYKRPGDAEWLFTAYGPDARFENAAWFNFWPALAPHSVGANLREALGKEKNLSVSSARWDGAQAADVAAGKFGEAHFYFQPDTWALVGWSMPEGGSGGRIRYEAGSSPLRLSRAERWFGLGDGTHAETVDEVTELTFGPVAKEKLTFEGMGLKPPPLDLIGDAVPPIADIEGTTCEVDARAEEVLRRVVKAYEGVTSAELRGTVNVTATGDDEQKTDWTFTAYYDGGRYRHDVARRMSVGCDGQHVYAYAANLNGHLEPHSFVQMPRAVAESNRELIPGLTAEVLNVQNPALGMLVEKDRRAMLLRGAKRVQRMADAEVGGVTCQEILIRGAKRGWSRRFRVDAQTGLIREARFTMPTASTDAAPGKDLSIVLHYDKEALGAKVDPENVAWRPPQGAQNLSPLWARLIGHPAPEATFVMLDGKRVELSAMKGKLVLLDFWASWCAPCRYTLPHVQELYAAHHAAGLEVVAVNLQERPEKLRAFLRDFDMKSPVALDRDGSIFKKYGGGGIPKLVVIGPDGVVKEVVTGSTDASLKRMTQLVEDGMKELKR